MTLSILVWILWLLWLLLGGMTMVRTTEGRNWQGIGLGLLPLLAVAVVGWAVFGPIVRDGG